MTPEALDGIIEATKQEIMNIQQQIQVLLGSKQASADSIFVAEAGDSARAHQVGYGKPLFTMNGSLLKTDERWY